MTENSNMSSEEELFLEALKNDPSLIDKLKKRDSLLEFKEKYKVQGASPFKCPSCAALMQSPGTLWGPIEGTRNQFVCRKCKLVWEITPLNKNIDDLSKELKEALKGQ